MHLKAIVIIALVWLFLDRTVLFCEHLFVSKVLMCVPQTLIQIFWTHIIYWPTRVVALRHCFAVLHSVAPISNPFELFICKYPFDFNCMYIGTISNETFETFKLFAQALKFMGHLSTKNAIYLRFFVKAEIISIYTSF